TATEVTAMRAVVRFRMTPWLPPPLEGDLDFSARADDELADDQLHGDSAPTSRAAVAAADEARVALLRTRLPAPRADEAFARWRRRQNENGLRMRLVLDVTFPYATPDDVALSIDALVALINDSSTVYSVDA